MPRGVPIPPTKIVPCIVCEGPMEVGHKTRVPKRCVACAIKAEAAAAIQIAQKSGPYYERWLNGMVKATQRLILTYGGGAENGDGQEESSL